MKIEEIEAVLNSNRRLSPAQNVALREFANDERLAIAAKALQLIRANPSLCDVTDADVPWLERAADRTGDAHLAANALSLLCDWLGRGDAQVRRLHAALRSSAEGGDYLCITACTLAGRLLAQKPDAALAVALKQVLHDPQRSTGTREAARDAFLVASGMSSAEIVRAEMSGKGDLWHRADAAATALAAAGEQ